MPRPPFLRSTRLVLIAAAMTGGAVAQPASAPADPMARRLQACTVCHGKEGRSTNSGYFPRIAGKPAGYLYNQLLNFRDGRRSNAAMSYLIDHMSDRYLREIADHFAALELPYPPPQPPAAPPATLQIGEALVRQGDAARGIAACNDCHGARMTGVVPAVPGLLGLPRDYLIAQIGAWQTGLRRATAPDCMADVAKRLQPEQVTAVASWLAAQPLPADPRPAPRAETPPPQRCGP